MAQNVILFRIFSVGQALKSIEYFFLFSNIFREKVS